MKEFMIIWQVMIETSKEALLPHMGPATDKHEVCESFVKLNFSSRIFARMNEFRPTVCIYI